MMTMRRPGTYFLLVLCTFVLGACQTLSNTSQAPSLTEQVDQLIRLGDRTQASGDTQSALAFYQRAHGLDPDHKGAFIKVANTLELLDERHSLEQFFASALERTPEDSELLRLYANRLISNDKIPQAIIHLQNARDLDPNEAKTHNSLGVAFDLSGNHEKAQTSYQTALSLGPDNLETLNNLALSYALLGAYEKAADLLKPYGFDVTAPERLRLNLALIYGLMDREEDARAVAEQILDRESVENNLEIYRALRKANEQDRKDALLSPTP